MVTVRALARLLATICLFQHSQRGHAFPYLRPENPTVDNDIKGLAELFPRCRVNVVTAATDEPVGQLGFPHMLTAPWKLGPKPRLNDYFEYQRFLYRGQAMNCQLTIIVGIQNIFRLNPQAAFVTSCMEGQLFIGIGDYAMTPRYVVTLVNEDFKTEGWSGVRLEFIKSEHISGSWRTCRGSSHGITPVKPSGTQYLRPFNLDLWIFLASALTLIAAVTALFAYALIKSLKASLIAFINSFHWLVAALLDQVEGPAPSHFGRLAIPQEFHSAVMKMFLLALPCIIHLSDTYRASLSLNYLTGTEHTAKWKGLKDVQHLTLFMTLENSKWERLCQHRFWFCCVPKVSGGIGDMTKDHVKLCSLRSRTKADGAFCHLFTSYLNLYITQREHNCLNLAFFMNYDALKGKISFYEGCTSEYVKLHHNLRMNARAFPADQLDTIIAEELTRPETALVTTKAHLPNIWPAFERAMKQNRSVTFKNNYEISDDESLPGRKDGIMVGIGLNRSFT